MSLTFKYLDGVHPELKSEILAFARWLRQNYTFETPLEIRLIPKDVIVDFDGVECALRWWQNKRKPESVKGEIAVKSFELTLINEGPTVAFPTVIAAIGRVLKYYLLAIHDLPESEDVATKWGDRLLDAYCDKTSPPPSG